MVGRVLGILGLLAIIAAAFACKVRMEENVVQATSKEGLTFEAVKRTLSRWEVTDTNAGGAILFGLKDECAKMCQNAIREQNSSGDATYSCRFDKELYLNQQQKPAPHWVCKLIEETTI